MAMAMPYMALALSLLPLRPPPRMAAGADDSFQVLSALVVANGGFVGPICCKSNGGLRGLYVTEPVNAGDPLCAVPRACTIHARAADGLKDNCLLYTSPSPRDGLLSRMPSSA